MTGSDLTELLERSADRIPVDTPPTSHMVLDAERMRRRRWTGVAAGAAAAVVAVAGGTALLATGGPNSPTPPVGGETHSPTTDPVPDGRRLVGIGHSAIAVPETWATNALQCGTATRPTVVVDVTVVPLCGWIAPKTYDDVWIEPGVNRAMFHPVTTFEIDGVTAQRDETTCTSVGKPTSQCTGTVYLPSVDATYRAEASTAERVDEILSWIRILPDRVAVPGYNGANDRYQDDDAGEHYRRQLAAAGLQVEVTTVQRPGKPGYILGTSPAPGTMLPPGAVVQMTEIGDSDAASAPTGGPLGRTP